LKNPVRCSLRGKFKNDFNLKKDKLFKVDIAVVGDWVEYELNNDGTGVIHEISDRKNYLSRKAPKLKGVGYRGERLEQVIASNVDNLFIVNSVKDPVFNNKVVDRIIVAGESSHLKIILLINKVDLGLTEEINKFIELYESLGYKVLLTCAKFGTGLEDIKKELKGKKNIFWGHSGVGKSSILNSLYPDLNLKTAEISKSTSKGRHTTVTSLLMEVEENTFIIDTPGVREIDPYGITKENLSHYFIEFQPHMKDCRFNTCTHFHEPDCGVTGAVDKELISYERYESYLNILETIEDDMVF